MEYIRLSNGVEMPLLGYGVFQVSPDECERCLTDALSVGYRLIDTLGSLFLTGIGYPYLRYEKQVLARQSTLAPGIANTFLILVGLCRINQAIAYT